MSDALWKAAVAGQLGAALETLERAFGACPDRLWQTEPADQSFWYNAFHTLFWTDLYTSGAVEGFAPPSPYTLDELEPGLHLPERVYSKAELTDYLAYVRRQAGARLAVVTDEEAAARARFSWLEMTVVEAWIYNIRHVQHHAGQLQRLLRDGGVIPPRWVRRGDIGSL